jgi:2-polyprenyl-6-methoxyphenol hydroxylase-like FAD-dependent oxidoreductase
VLVVGAGPAGLIAALQLSKNGTRCMLIERNLDTTRWPKMDITNCRSMELLKRLGVDGGLREVGEFSLSRRGLLHVTMLRCWSV